jgi:hypothetical protein
MLFCVLSVIPYLKRLRNIIADYRTIIKSVQ